MWCDYNTHTHTHTLTQTHILVHVIILLSTFKLYSERAVCRDSSDPLSISVSIASMATGYHTNLYEEVKDVINEVQPCGAAPKLGLAFKVPTQYKHASTDYGTKECIHRHLLAY